MITNIGELVTSDDTGERPAGDPVRTRPWSSRTAASPGSVPARTRRPPTRGRRRRPRRAPRLRRQPQPPGLRRRPGGRVRRPDGRRSRTRRRHPHHGRRHPGRRATTSCAPTGRPGWPSCGAAGHHHHGDQERLRPDRRRRGPALRVAGEFTDETTFLGAHVVPAEYAARPGRLRRPGQRPDAGGRRAVRPLDRRVLRRRRAFDGDQARGVLAAGRAAGLGPRVHANQLGPGPGCSWRSSSARPAPTTAPT